MLTYPANMTPFAVPVEGCFFSILILKYLFQLYQMMRVEFGDVGAYDTIKIVGSSTFSPLTPEIEGETILGSIKSLSRAITTAQI